MIDRTIWFLYNRLSSEAQAATNVNVTAGMFFNYWKIMNSIGIASDSLSPIDIYNSINACYDRNARTSVKNMYEHGEVNASAEYTVSYYEQDHSVYDVYANCNNLNEVLMNGDEPEFDDTQPFNDELENIVYDEIEYEVESSSYSFDENSLEWHRCLHPEDDKLTQYLHQAGESLEVDEIDEFLMNILSDIDDNNRDMHHSRIVKFMLDRLVYQNKQLIESLELTESGVEKEVDTETGELKD